MPVPSVSPPRKIQVLIVDDSLLFRKTLEEGRADVTIKCADEPCYREVVEGLIDGQEIFRYLSDEEGRVAYAQNEKQLSLTFWVTNE